MLVANENCNLWNERTTKSIASQQNFYIVLKDKEEADDMSRKNWKICDIDFISRKK